MKRVKVDHKDKMAKYLISDYLLEEIGEKFTRDNIVFACIGTDRCVGDAIGPIVGSMLKEHGLTVIGDLPNPMHALNLEKRVAEMKVKYKDKLIIGIDACLGDDDSIGHVQARDYAINPGRGVGKNLPQVGEYSIIGIVDSSENNELFTNRTIRLNLVMEMSKLIVDSILRAFAEQTRKNNIA